MKIVLIGLMLFSSVSSFAKTFVNPTWEGRPFQSSKNMANIACYLMTISSERSYEAVRFENSKISVNELPEAWNGGFGGNNVGLISKDSYFWGPEDALTAKLLIESIPADSKKSVKVISYLECK